MDKELRGFDPFTCTSELRPSFKKTWVAALRSGKYEQGKEWMKRISFDGQTYCCLGVLREVCSVEGRNSLHILTTQQLKQIGLSYDDQNTLAYMNDGTGGMSRHSFKEIAEWIEDNL